MEHNALGFRFGKVALLRIFKGEDRFGIDQNLFVEDNGCPKYLVIRLGAWKLDITF